MNKASIYTNQIIETWKTNSSADYAYFEKVEDSTIAFWSDDSIFFREFKKIDISKCLEIACGHGRHSEKIVDTCKMLYLLDTSIDAINYVKKRFSGKVNISIHLSKDGASLEFIEDDSLTSVFSYDAMVHFEMFTIWKYLNEIYRVLKPGGMALLHHSIYDANPVGQFSDNPGWRNYMSESTFKHMVSRCGFELLTFTPIDWACPKSDALTLLKKPAA